MNEQTESQVETSSRCDSQELGSPRRNDIVVALAAAGVIGAIGLAAWIGDFPVPEEPSSWHPPTASSQVSPVAVDSDTLGSHTEPAVMTLRRSPEEREQMELNIRIWLGDLHKVQTEWQARRAIDENQNDLGEFAFLGELNGIHSERCSTRAYATTVQADLARIDNSIANVHGYMVQIFLPDPDDQAVTEASNGGIGVVRPDPDRSERFWCCYAWPEQRTKTGTSVFFIDQSGVVLRSRNKAHEYSGRFRRPLPSAAFAIDSEGQLGSPIALDSRGHDGQYWVQIK